MYMEKLIIVECRGASDERCDIGNGVVLGSWRYKLCSSDGYFHHVWTRNDTRTGDITYYVTLRGTTYRGDSFYHLCHVLRMDAAAIVEDSFAILDEP